MGRRSVHTPEELRDLILNAATDLIEQGGLAALSAREIARAIGYSPGTLYNVFENLDDVVLTIEARLLDQLSAKLSEAADGAAPRERISRLAHAYLSFTHQNPKLWNLLFEHHLPADRAVPPWYKTKLEGLMTQLEDALAARLDGHEPASIKQAARVLWAGVHGITSLSTADKLSTITSEAAGPLVEDLLQTYLAGLVRSGNDV
jgi:AcrR family transcriptional regulator